MSSVEGALRRDGLPFALGIDVVASHAPETLGEPRAPARAEPPPEPLIPTATGVVDGAQPRFGECSNNAGPTPGCRRARARAGRRARTRPDDVHAGGLAPGRRELRDESIRAAPDRGGDGGRSSTARRMRSAVSDSDSPLKRRSVPVSRGRTRRPRRPRPRVPGPRARGGPTAPGGHRAARDGHDGGVGTEAQRLARGHGRADAVRAGLVRGGGHHPPSGRRSARR
jgi:hypothetical protein